MPERADLGGNDLPVITRDAPRPSQPPLVAAQRHPLDRALQMYMAHIHSENAALHIENKVSILRRFLGDGRIAAALGFKKTRGKPSEGAFFEGEFLDELTPTLLQEFIGTLPVSTKTKRHHRKFFHHFFEINLKFGFFQPVNWHCPNPVAALPSYVKKNRHIVFLTAAQVDEQHRALEPHPAMHLAVAVMIFAGLRRAETLWLAPDHIASDRSYLSVVNRTHSDEDIESSLKTGAWAVTIFPPLRTVLTAHQITGVEGKWLISTANGKRWRGDSFGKQLEKINGAAGLGWTSLRFRHTYATQSGPLRAGHFSRSPARWVTAWRSSRKTMQIISDPKEFVMLPGSDNSTKWPSQTTSNRRWQIIQFVIPKRLTGCILLRDFPSMAL